MKKIIVVSLLSLGVVFGGCNTAPPRDNSIQQRQKQAQPKAELQIIFPIIEYKGSHYCFAVPKDQGLQSDVVFIKRIDQADIEKLAKVFPNLTVTQARPGSHEATMIEEWLKQKEDRPKEFKPVRPPVKDVYAGLAPPSPDEVFS